MKPFIKRLGALVIVLLLTLAFCVPIFAEEMPADDVVTEEVVTPTDVTAEPETSNFFDRVKEFVETYIAEIVTAGSTIAVAVYTIYQKNSNGTMFTGIKRLLTSQGDVENVSNRVADALDKVEEKQEQLNKYYEEYARNEQERNKVTAALLVEVMALLETNHIMYINNSNIPQSMKNLMTSKYARCLSYINDDAELKEAYDEMRGILGISEARANEKKDT